MTIIDAFPKICKIFPGVTAALVHLGMSLVGYYHIFCESPWVNTSFEEARGLEKVANVFLMPAHYLCEGKAIAYDGEHFRVKQRFQYETGKKIYSPVALTFFTPGLILGTVCKKVALLSPEVAMRHNMLKQELRSKKISSKNDYYYSLGIPINDWRKGEKLISQGYKRRPGDENVLLPDKEALKEIITLLSKAEIPFWVDCGTCIGTFRYEGVLPWDNDIDIAVLVSDFQNVRHALRRLDRKKYVAQDWSDRGRPEAYIRVYIKESRNHIDIYHNDIDAENKTVKYIIAHENSPFMATDWKERERRQASPIPFDVIFPLKRGNFDGIEVPVPNQTARFIQTKYGPNITPPWIYNEETGDYEKDLSHPYWEIPLAH